MSLRFQLLALSALTLLLPWAGLRMVQAFETSLRTALESSLLDTARANIVVTELAESQELGQSGLRGASLDKPLFVHGLSRPPRLDGSFSDWHFTRAGVDEDSDERALHLDDGSRLWVGVSSSFLYLYVEVTDDEVVHQGAPGVRPHGDRVVLMFGNDAMERGTLLLVNSAEGPFRAQLSRGAPLFDSSGAYYDTARGYWRDTGTGYVIEARLPTSLAGNALGIAIVDSVEGGNTALLAASTWGDTLVPNGLVSESPRLNGILSRFSGRGDRMRIVDAGGWVIADSGPLQPAAAVDTATSPSLMERFFRYVLRRDDPDYSTHETQPSLITDPALRAALEGEDATAWYRRGADVSAIVIAAVPIDPNDPNRGAVLLERATDPILTLTNQAMMRLMTTTVVMTLIVALALLAYASFLSFRIGRLARAAESALGPRGEINVRLPGAKGGDEIGDLSRAFADLLGRLREYTDYLQGLKSKLSHELRTPLAIVATSLDNLEHELTSGPGKDYLARLRHGTERLESILQAMTAATRVEQAISQAELERFDLAALVAACVAAYHDVYPGQAFEANLPAEPVLIDGSAELIEQLLDKLIDNAVGFATAGSAIEVNLDSDSRKVCLTVVNRGPLLPEAMRHQLFDSLVSVRESRGEKPHLGLGLYIVTLVAELHRGQVEAENLADGSGVRISVELPCADAGSS
jgi:dedicated sortase system histidine kinase